MPPMSRIGPEETIGVLILTLEGHPLAPTAIQMLGHLKPLFEAFQKENYQTDITKNLTFQKTII